MDDGCIEKGRLQRATAHVSRTDPGDLSPWAFEVTVEDIDEHTRLAAHVNTALFNLVRLVVEENTLAHGHISV